MPYDVVDAVETDLTAATGEGALDGWWYDTDETDREPYVSQFLLCELKLWAMDASHEYLRYRGGDRSEPAAERQRGPRRDAATPRHGGQRRAAVSGVPDRDDGSVFAYADTGPVGLLDTLTRVARRALSVREGNEDDRSTASVEGSPVHPAYPSGHSVVAGACSTVLNTWVADVALPYDATSRRQTDRVATRWLPSGHAGADQETDELTSKVGLARTLAGVHCYGDHYRGWNSANSWPSGGWPTSSRQLRGRRVDPADVRTGPRVRRGRGARGVGRDARRPPAGAHEPG